jgi:DNA-binding NarL/FixJ family response regulator
LSYKPRQQDRVFYDKKFTALTIYTSMKFVYGCVGNGDGAFGMSSLGKVRLFIADDHPAFCDRLATFLAGMVGVEVVGLAENAPKAIASIRRIKPDAVILDIRMPPGAGGFDVLREIRSGRLAPTVIMLTAFPSEEYRQMSMEMGAEFFFDKSRDFRKMLTVIRDLAVRRRKNASEKRA